MILTVDIMWDIMGDAGGDFIMKLATIRELKNNPARVIREAKQGDVLVTARGKPMAIVKAITPEELEDYVLVHSKELKGLMKEAEDEFKAFLSGKLKEAKTGRELLEEAKKEIGSQ